MIETITEVHHRSHGTLFKEKYSALLHSEIMSAEEEINHLEKQVKALKGSCEHSELTEDFTRDTIRGEAYENERNSYSYEAIQVKVHHCKVCGKTVYILPDGSWQLGW
jgi:hypothetical protein